MMRFEDLLSFVTGGGTATLWQLAHALLAHDRSQLSLYEKR